MNEIAIPYDLSSTECSGYDVTTGSWCCEVHELNNELLDSWNEPIELF
jgi:hypothetical protein